MSTTAVSPALKQPQTPYLLDIKQFTYTERVKVSLHVISNRVQALAVGTGQHVRLDKTAWFAE
jgi:hypothetical protein